MIKNNILIFGAAGFIATYLIDELLSQGHAITASDIGNSGIEYFKSRAIRHIDIDITKKEQFEALANERFDAVIHLAACQPANVSEQKYDPLDYISVNVIGTLNILEYCKRSGSGKLIYASSHRNTQGLWQEQKPIQETDGRALKYDGEYAMFSISESAAQDCVTHYQAQYGLNAIIFRLPPVYGYGPHTEIFKDGVPIKTGFQVFIDKARASEPLEIWGDGDIGRDIIYVKDVVSAFVKTIESKTATGLYNITSGQYLTLREQAETIARLFWGSASKPVFTERPDKPNGMDSFLYDNSKAKAELNWAPVYSFEDMLQDYQRESDSKRFECLVNKRQKMLKNT
jgi:UDP-glucose 4-epimerase